MLAPLVAFYFSNIRPDFLIGRKILGESEVAVVSAFGEIVKQ